MAGKAMKDLKLRQLETQLTDWRRLVAKRPFAPKRGWIHEIRTVLGMSSDQLARRMGVSQPVVARFEGNEAEGGITLKPRRRAAAALNCDVAYALVPRANLQETLERRAFEVANRLARQVSHSMELEDQGVPKKETELQVSEIAKELLARRPRELWDAP